MTWKGALNSALTRSTGYHLTRESPEERREALREASRKAADRVRREAAAARQREERRHQQREAQRREEQARAKAAEAEARRDKLRARFDERLCTTIETVAPHTMTSTEKLAALVEATRYVVRHRVPGHVVECGVWRGGSMQAVALTLLELDSADRELHLFDTFEGMPPPSENDTRTTGEGSVSADELLAASDKDSRMWAIAPLDGVKTVMSETGYPDQLIHYHPGLVEDTTPGQAPDTIAILRLDTDWYASTKHELTHLYDRLSPGGVLILDDYGDWEGARKATDEWLAETGEQIFLAPMGTGCIGIKPWSSGPAPA